MGAINETARKLNAIHTHAELLLKYKYCGKGGKYMDNPDEIVFREKDIIKLLTELGYKPDWGEE